MQLEILFLKAMENVPYNPLHLLSQGTGALESSCTLKRDTKGKIDKIHIEQLQIGYWRHDSQHGTWIFNIYRRFSAKICPHMETEPQ